MKLTTKILGLLMAFFAIPAISLACSFTQEANLFKTPSENANSYPYIFYGTVIKKVDSPDGFGGVTYGVDVEYDISGNVPEMVKLVSPGHSCGWFSEVGISMIFFLNDLNSIDASHPKYSFENSGELWSVIYDIEGAQAGGVTTVQVCTKEYKPVCAERVVQCIQAPCPPVLETISNRCVAESQDLNVLYEGACKPVVATPPVQAETTTTLPQVPEELTEFSEPVSGPPTKETFTSPTTPPPNVIQDEKIEELMTFWESVRAFFSRVFGGLLFWR